MLPGESRIMTTVTPKKFKWVRTLSARENVNMWREKRKSMREDFESRNAAARSSFGNAWANQVSGAAELGAQAALKRIQDEATAKADKLAAERAGDITIPSTKNSVFSVDSAPTMAGGSKVDLDLGTLTLPDGTVIDVKTGIKKVSVVV